MSRVTRLFRPGKPGFAWFLLLAGLAFLACGFPAFAQESLPAVLQLSDQADHYPLGPYLRVLEDPGGDLSLDQVRSAEMAGRWRENQAAIPSFGFTRGAVWLRFRVQDQARQAAGWLLELAHPYLDQVDFYGPYAVGPEAAGAGARQVTTGLGRYGQPRDYPHANFVFLLKPPPGAEAEYFLRLASASSVRAPLSIWSSQALAVHDGQHSLVWGAALGIFLVFSVYYLLQFIALREPSYLYLAVYASSLVVSYAVHVTGPFLLDSLGTRVQSIMVFAGMTEMLSLLLFADDFLEMRQHSLEVHRLFRVGAIFLALTLPLTLLGPSRWNIVFVYLVFILFTLLFLAGGLAAWRKHRNSRYLLPALALPLLTAVVQAALRLGLADFDFSGDLLPVAGNVAMVLLLSLAQADRIRQLQVDLMGSNQALQESRLRLARYLDALPLGVAVYDVGMRLTYANPAVREILGVDRIPENRTYQEVDADFHLLRYGSGETYPVAERPMQMAMRGVSAQADDLLLVSGERHIPLHAWCSPIFDSDGQLAAVMSIFADISQRRLMEAQLAQANQEQQSRLQELIDQHTRQEQRQRLLAESLQRSAAVLNSDLNLDTVLANVLDQLHQVISFDAASIFIQDGEDLILSDSTGLSELQLGLHLPIADDYHPAVRVFRQGQSLVLPDRRTALQGEDCLAASGACFWMGTPLVTAGEVLGVLVVDGASADPENRPALPVLEAFASHAAIAITNARLFRQARSVAISEERSRLARDLHDSVTQTLFSAALIAEAVPELWKLDPAAAAFNLEKLRKLARGALAEMRSLLLELRPQALVDAPIERLLDNLRDAFSGRTNIPAQLDIFQQDGVLLPNEVKIVLYRIAQEALNNVGKHAGATQVSIVYRAEDSQVELVIQDDGQGFDPDQPAAGRIGLRSMQERARSIGADLRIRSVPGGGAAVKVAWQPGEAEYDRE